MIVALDLLPQHGREWLEHPAALDHELGVGGAAALAHAEILVDAQLQLQTLRLGIWVGI